MVQASVPMGCWLFCVVNTLAVFTHHPPTAVGTALVGHLSFASPREGKNGSLFTHQRHKSAKYYICVIEQMAWLNQLYVVNIKLFNCSL